MPTNIAELVWIVGGGVLLLTLALLGFFFVRLISSLDDFKKDISGAVHELRATLELLRDVMGQRVGDLNARVRVIEEAGCIVHRKGVKDVQP